MAAPIAYVSAGTVGTGTTSVTPGAPASLADGDLVPQVIVTKPNTATIGLSSGWTLVGSNNGGAGAVGVGTGPTKVTVQVREKSAAWSTMPTTTVGSGAPSAVQAFRFTKEPANQWLYDNRNATYNSGAAATALNVTPTAIDVGTGDWILVAISNHSHLPTWSAQSFTATGITFGAVTEFSEAIENSVSNGVGGAFWGAPITAGAGSVAIQVQATASAASTGALVLVRLRDVEPWTLLTPTPRYY